MVIDFSGVDWGAGLRDEFGSRHVLAVPEGGAVEGYFNALGAGCVGWDRMEE